MVSTNAMGEILTTLFDRRPFSRGNSDARPMAKLCDALLADKTEVSGLQVATAVLNRYQQMDDDQKVEFFSYLNDVLDLDPKDIALKAQAYADEPTGLNFKSLTKSAEPKRQELLRRLNQAPGATAELVRMRADLLAQVKTAPNLAQTDYDFEHLLKSWFNRGFLVLRQINWESPAAILEKIIAYEAVHEIHTWDDLRRRLHPADRRCFAFFHPSMPDEPLIFVEVALTKGVPGSIQDVLTERREVHDESDVDTAVFYSISNCQKGLAGISFGNSLIKQVAHDLGRDLPGLKTFVTLSPIPGLVRWLDRQDLAEAARNPQNLKRLSAQYLLNAKTADGKPLDPVARFHLGNGAMVHNVHAAADLTENGMAQSRGAMVNYLYDLSRISANLVHFADRNTVAASPSIKTLAKQAGKLIGTVESGGA